MANTPNISRDSFDWTKWYSQVVLQQGVPVDDSDWNELGDIQIIEKIIRGAHVFGDMFLPASVANLQGEDNPGYQVQQATVTTQNFKITGGWAMCKGLLVPTTTGYPPIDHDYEDDTNLMGVGEVTSVNGGAVTISDDEMNWQTFHDLVGCRVKMTSGTESGNTFTVVAKTNATTLQLNSVGAIAATDTYIVKPPALTTPSGDRDDEVYLMVWIEGVGEIEDTVLTHPGTGIASCYRKQIKWCVRVEEGGVTPSTPDIHDVASAGSVRYVKMALLERLNTNVNILTAMITPEPSSSKLSLGSRLPGLLVAEPSSQTAIFAATDKVQLTGTFYVGKGAGVDPTSFFTVHASSPLENRRNPYINSGDLVTVTQVRDSSDVGALTMASDPTNAGFYTDPYIVLSKSISATVYIHCMTQSYMSDLTQATAILIPGAVNDVIPHADSIQSPAQAGTPSAITANTISHQTGQMLTLVNNRVSATEDYNITGVWEFEGDTESIEGIDQVRFRSVPYANSLQGGSCPPGISPRQIAMNGIGFNSGAYEANGWAYPYSPVNRPTLTAGSKDTCVVVKNDASGIPQKYLCVFANGGASPCDLHFFDIVSGDEYASWSFELETFITGSSQAALACCSDGDTVYCLFGDVTNNYQVQAFDWVNKTYKAGWPASGVALNGTWTTSVDLSEYRMCIADDTYLAVAKTWQALTSGATLGIAILELADGTMTEGNGDFAGSYHSSSKARCVCSDGTYVYFSVLNYGSSFEIHSINPASPAAGCGFTGIPGATTASTQEIICTGEQLVLLEDTAIEVYPFIGGTPAIFTIADTGVDIKHICRGAFDGENIWVADMDASVYPDTAGNGIALLKIPAAELRSNHEFIDCVKRVFLTHSELSAGTAQLASSYPMGKVLFDGDSIWFVKDIIASSPVIVRVPRAMYR